jgi:orsellinic acid/F9775 biosynthesis protein OrsD
MSAEAQPVFRVAERWGLIICEPCQYVVWPKHIASHCGKRHGMDTAQAAAIAAGYENAANLKQGPGELELPTSIEPSIPFLPIRSGLACQVDPDTCHYVCITVSSMESHIKVAHRPEEQHTTATRLRQRQQQQATGEDTRRWRDTFCQRFFTNGKKSSYFAVQNGTIPNRSARTDSKQEDFGDFIGHAATGFRTIMRDTIVEGRGHDEPDSLLQWTGWDKYLKGYEWADLLALIQRPDPENPDKEPMASAIWKVTEETINIANETVREAATETRLQATRIREAEHRVIPLQAIPDARNVVKYARQWQAVMMFFARTQEWRSWRRCEKERLRRLNLTFK